MKPPTKSVLNVARRLDVYARTLKSGAQHYCSPGRFVELFLGSLFPHWRGEGESVASLCAQLDRELPRLISSLGMAPPGGRKPSVISRLPRLQRSLVIDAQAILRGDPAARSLDEVILTYPGFYAIAAYRLAHELQKFELGLLPRLISAYAHQRTGIDIHPSAKIGQGFCIDHGTGVVVGETTMIGNRVKLYQGVTLGALSVSKKLSDVKRHPTLKDDVVVYANATILGGSTVVGKGSVIGGNVWLTHSVPAYSTVYAKEEVITRPNK